MATTLETELCVDVEACEDAEIPCDDSRGCGDVTAVSLTGVSSGAVRSHLNGLKSKVLKAGSMSGRGRGARGKGRRGEAKLSCSI